MTEARLNYHHLYYFWLVAREGSLVRASRLLRLAPSTLSGQIRELEGALGDRLFARRGRGLVLTEAGRTTNRYADEIFALGSELLDALQGRAGTRPLKLNVGVADVLPKPIVRRLLEPALRTKETVRVACSEGKSVGEFAGQLARHELDVLLADTPVAPDSPLRAFNHVLGECGTTFFGTKALAARHRRGFPGSLRDAPLLMPSPGSTLRRGLDQWLAANGIRPTIVGEFDDSALMNVFGQDGLGVFAGPSVIERDVVEAYDVEVIGRADDLRQRFYAISVERRLKHPAVVAITEGARRDLF